MIKQITDSNMIECVEPGLSIRITWDDKPSIEKATEIMLGENWRAIAHKPEEIRKAIFELEEWLLTLPQEYLPINHKFAGGVYAREMLAPAGTIITGKIHKHDHINILSKGSITVVTEYGVEHIKAPCTMISKAGSKRVGYTHEDCVWTSIHATNAKTVEEAESELFTNDYTEYLTYSETKQ